MDGRPLGRLEPLLTEMLQAQRRWMGWLIRPEKKTISHSRAHGNTPTPSRHPLGRSDQGRLTQALVGTRACYCTVQCYHAVLAEHGGERVPACLPACL